MEDSKPFSEDTPPPKPNNPGQSGALIDTDHNDQLQDPAKIEKDIAFLEHRLRLLKAQKHPNRASIKIHESMLRRRELMLEDLYQRQHRDQNQ